MDQDVRASQVNNSDTVVPGSAWEVVGTNPTSVFGPRRATVKVLSYVEQLTELRGDRFFAVVSKELRAETMNSVAEGLFRPADESLHHPPPGFTRAGSFKTPDHYGNLQLSFFMNGNDCMVDIDIDDAAGVEHIFQVVHNSLSGQPTHPYNIHEILVSQHLDPGYTFQV